MSVVGLLWFITVKSSFSISNFFFSLQYLSHFPFPILICVSSWNQLGQSKYAQGLLTMNGLIWSSCLIMHDVCHGGTFCMVVKKTKWETYKENRRNEMSSNLYQISSLHWTMVQSDMYYKPYLNFGVKNKKAPRDKSNI